MRASLMIALALVVFPGLASARTEDYGDEQASQSANYELYQHADNHDEAQVPGQSRDDELQRSPDKPCEGACN